jgi:HlyD family secretion protein
MKRIVILLFATGVLAGAAWTVRWSFAQSSVDGGSAAERPVVRDLVDKTVASGRIVPAREISVKSRVSGVIVDVFVAPGQRVRRGDPLVNIEPVPDELRLSELRRAVNEALIEYRYADRELVRSRGLAAAGAAASSTVDAAEREVTQRALALRVAREQLRLVRDGGTAASRHKGSIVRATADGTVLNVPVEPGHHIIEASPHNEGTTVALIADLDDMIFVGHVDEADAAALRLSMPLALRIAALPGLVFPGRLEFIAPQSRAGAGPTTFEIRASIARTAEATLRAGYSANAEIVLARVEQALCVREALVQFDGERTFVDVVRATGQVDRREVRTGLSDGIYIEILAGITPDVAVRVPGADDRP